METPRRWYTVFRNMAFMLGILFVGLVPGCLLGILGVMLVWHGGGLVGYPIAAARGWFNPVQSKEPPRLVYRVLAGIFGFLGFLFFLNTVGCLIMVFYIFTARR